eukprot:1832002-Pleurochrysis_carterae.AAC.2
MGMPARAMPHCTQPESAADAGYDETAFDEQSDSAAADLVFEEYEDEDSWECNECEEEVDDCAVGADNEASSSPPRRPAPPKLWTKAMFAAGIKQVRNFEVKNL